MSLSSRGICSAVLASVLVLAGCGGGGDGDLVGNVAVAQADWIIVDLRSGKASGQKTAPDLSDDQFRTNQLVLVALPAGSGASGSPAGVRWGLPDEVAGTAGAGKIFVSVFEITRAQWQFLASTTPWSRLDTTLLGPDDGRLAATGMSLELANAGCASANAWSEGSFRLPQAGEWEYACRAGSTARYSWGDASDSATVGLYAQVAETTGANPGPQRVGSLRANAFGLFDMEGGVWELCADGAMRGGSWRDSVPMARAANKISLDQTTPHALAGLRLIYQADGP
jgi:formylglycine-generating enzyme required for sulfatase activity